MHLLQPAQLWDNRAPDHNKYNDNDNNNNNDNENNNNNDYDNNNDEEDNNDRQLTTNNAIVRETQTKSGADDNNINDTDSTTCTTLVVVDETFKEVSSLLYSGTNSGQAVLGFNSAIVVLT